MKKAIKISIAVVISLGIIGIIAYFTVPVFYERNAEEKVKIEIDKAISSANLDDKFSYSEIDVKSTKGTIEIADISYAEGDANLTVRTLQIKLPPSQALALYRNPDNTTLTDAEIKLEDLNITSTQNDSVIDLGNSTIKVQGTIPSSVFNATSIETVKELNPVIDKFVLELNNSKVYSSSNTGSVTIGKYSLDVQGDFTIESLESTGDNPLLQMQKLDSFATNIEELQVELSEEQKEDLIEGLMFFVDIKPLIENPDNLKLGKINVAFDREGKQINLKNLELMTNFLQIKTSGVFNLSESINMENDFFPAPPFDFQIEIADYNTSLRPLFEFLAAGFSDQPLPEGGFTIQLSQKDSESDPEISIE